MWSICLGQNCGPYIRYALYIIKAYITLYHFALERICRAMLEKLNLGVIPWLPERLKRRASPIRNFEKLNIQKHWKREEDRCAKRDYGDDQKFRTRTSNKYETMLFKRLSISCSMKTITVLVCENSTCWSWQRWFTWARIKGQMVCWCTKS